MKPRLTFIINKRINHRKQIIKEIEEVFIDYPKIILQTEYSFQAMLLTKEHAEDSDIILAVGGDSIFNEVLNGLMSLPDTMQHRIVLGLIPAGIANDFSRSLNLSLDIRLYRNLIENESFETISIGKVKYKTTYNKDAHRYFVNDGEVGIAAQTVRRINKSTFLLTKSMTMTLATMQSFVNFKYPYVRIIADTIHWQGRITSVIFIRGKYFGGGLEIVPEADIFSDKMHLVLIEKLGYQDFIKNIYQFRYKKRVNNPRIHYFETNKLYIEPLEKREVWLQVDGVFLGKAPIEVQLVQKQIKLIVNKSKK